MPSSSTLIKNRTVLVLGCETALGRAAAQQFSRAGSKVVVCSRDEPRVDEITGQLSKKGGQPTGFILNTAPKEWPEDIIAMRRAVQHVHMVVNAHAFGYTSEEQAAARREEASLLDKLCQEEFAPRGPLRIATLWPAEVEEPSRVTPTAWHVIVRLAERQRLDAESPDTLDAGGTLHLRAGAVADTLVAMMAFPPSIRTESFLLRAVPSAEKPQTA